jgi:hypothetical protein
MVGVGDAVTTVAANKRRDVGSLMLRMVWEKTGRLGAALGTYTDRPEVHFVYYVGD